jgi:hypothetical protein
MYGLELIRTWQGADYKLDLYDSGRVCNGKSMLSYQFYHKEQLVFEGDDFGCSPMYCIDSDNAVAALLHFLSLKPGDTDREYFEDYTEQQLEFARDCGDDLYCYAEELEAA